METRIDANYSSQHIITEQTKQRIIEGNNKGIDSPVKNGESATVSISEEGIQKMKSFLESKGAEEANESGIKRGVIMTDFKYIFSGRFPSTYGEMKENGEYERNYRSIGEKADDLLSAYASVYDEIIKGYEDGTRETYVEDKNSEGGFRKLTKDEELDELDKAFEFHAKWLETRAKDEEKLMDAIASHAEKISKLSLGRARVASEYLSHQDYLERQKNELKEMPVDFTDRMVRASKNFVSQYALQKGGNLDIASILKGIKIF